MPSIILALFLGAAFVIGTFLLRARGDRKHGIEVHK
jgi:hypothetical protein